MIRPWLSGFKIGLLILSISHCHDLSKNLGSLTGLING